MSDYDEYYEESQNEDDYDNNETENYYEYQENDNEEQEPDEEYCSDNNVNEDSDNRKNYSDYNQHQNFYDRNNETGYSYSQPYSYNQQINNYAGEQLSNMQHLNLNEPEEVLQSSQQYEDQHHSSSLGSIVKGALDGFGGGNIHDIVGNIKNLSGGQGYLSNILASGSLETVASNLIANASHHFFGINPETGRIIGAIAGNIIFNLGGKDNSLSGIGKIILDNFISGKYKRKVNPFVPSAPNMPSFNLDFSTERNRCLNERRLFEDPEFQATDSSIYYNQPPKKRIEWKRPHEIINDPQLIISKQSRFDVVQGSLGDCWLLAATANLTLRDELFYRVVAPDQSFTENYAGIFHFQFWRYGKWVDVVIDDRLPTNNNELIYMHSAHHNAFWSALLEKAYAKLYGSYEALKGGSTAEAMEDFTGGLVEFYDLKKTPREQILALFVRGFQMGSLFGCSIDADPNVTEARKSNGLVRGHAYSITALQTVYSSQGETVLLRIRNPWGEHEWNGAWSDSAPEWNYISQEQHHALNIKFSEDGEFWMCFDDFFREFEQIEIANLGPEVMNEICEMTGITNAPKSPWTNFIVDDQWSLAYGTAGGCKNNDTFANNPQYHTSFSVNSNGVEHDGKVTVIVAVLQKYRRELRVKNLDSLPIGFAVFRCDSGGCGNYYSNLYGSNYKQKKDQSFFNNAEMVAKSASFIDLREVTGRFRLPPGNYVIVPSTFHPNEDAEFLLRVFSSGIIQAA